MEKTIQLLIESFPKILLPGLQVTLPLTVISFSIGLVIALFTAIFQVARVPVLRYIARFYVWVFRGTPLLVQLFVVFYGMPSVGIILDAFPSAVIVFALNTGAYASETIRAAIEAIPSGQMEAGFCVGMNYVQIMARIVLPQAMRIAFPSLGNTLIGLVKDTSLAAMITVTEMLHAAKSIASRNFQYLWLYIEVGVVYLLISTLMSSFQRWCEKKLSPGNEANKPRMKKKVSA